MTDLDAIKRAASQPPSGDAPDLREAAQEVIGAFTIAPGVTTGRQAKALEALRLAALAASAPSSPATPAPLDPRVKRMAYLAHSLLNIVDCPRCHLPRADGLTCPCGYDGSDE